MAKRTSDEQEWGGFEAALRGLEHPLGGQNTGGVEPADLNVPSIPWAQAPGGEEVAPRILVADDEPNIRRLLQVRLERAGYRPLMAADGIEALALAREHRPDLAILDVQMPGLNGFQVLEAVKMDPATHRIRVLMLTARSGDDHIRLGWTTGADFYMAKPFNPEELLSVLERFTAAIGAPDEPPPLRLWLK